MDAHSYGNAATTRFTSTAARKRLRQSIDTGSLMKVSAEKYAGTSISPNPDDSFSPAWHTLIHVDNSWFTDL